MDPLIFTLNAAALKSARVIAHREMLAADLKDEAVLRAEYEIVEAVFTLRKAEAERERVEAFHAAVTATYAALKET